MPQVSLDNLKTHYQQTGNGPDVVLLHGFTSNLAMWMFSPLLPALSSEFRVTSYDLRGHGMTDAPPSGYTSAELANDFAQLHDALDLGPAYVVGHSLGGVVGMHAALQHPEKIAGLILSDSYFPGLANLEPNMEQADVWHGLVDAFKKAGEDLGDTVDFQKLFDIVARLTPDQLQTIQDELGPESVRWFSQMPQLAKTSAAKESFEVAGLTAEALKQVQQPVVALYDEFSPFEATYQFLTENLPNAVGDIVPEAKHLALLENPEGFVERVQYHLRRLATLAGTAAADGSMSKQISTKG